MTNIEKRIENRLVEDKYAEKFHQLDMEENIAHIYRDNDKLREINEKRIQLGLDMELEQRLLGY